MNKVKTKKLASQISKEISGILANEAKDSLFKTVTITGTEVSSDISHAKIFFTSLSDLPKSEIEKELKDASGYLRTMLASKLFLRHTPILEFKYDESILYGTRIEQIIKEINDKK